MQYDDIMGVTEAGAVLGHVQDFVLSAVVSIGFAVFFSTPVKYIALAGLGGAVCHLSRSLCLAADLGIVASSFIASVVISMMFILIAPRIRVPRPVFTVSSIVPIIPGKYAYLTLISLINIHDNPQMRDRYIVSIFENGALTTFVMLAIGMGIAMPALLFYRNRPVV
jgi:uncharacterized membrane protein YjjB (DUF3815 family)